MSTENHLVIRRADETDAHTISILAHAIWPDAYGDILSSQQLQYMLGLFYSESSLHTQMRTGHLFFIAEISSEPVGFVSFSHDHTAGAYKIHKLYVHPMVQGKGVGKHLLARMFDETKKHHATTVRLNVNRNNPARDFYEKLGFVIVGDEDIAIGEGYFMNDFIMEKQL